MASVADPEQFLQALRNRDRELSDANEARRAMASTGAAVIHSVEPDTTRVEIYASVELKVDASGQWVNPFDPEDVRVDAVVTLPDGRDRTVPGFYMVDFERSRSSDGGEILTPTGDRGWRVRFTPAQPGTHTIRVVLDDGSDRATSDPVTIEAIQGERAGFVRRSAVAPRYLVHDDGSLYFPLGLNHGWPGSGATYDYDETIERTSSNLGNTVRVWLAPTFHRLSLETSEQVDDHGLMGGLGWINQDAAWRFDHVVRQAESSGIKVLPVAFSFSGWRSRNGPSNWAESPYNAELGGPLDSASKVFTDPVARKLAKRRLRYIVARYGHSTAVMAWELWNEVTGVDDYDDEQSADWHREMAAYLKSLDPYGRLVTTSTWWVEGTPRLDTIEDIDIVMTHEYNAVDHAIPHYGAGRWKFDAYRKPHMTGEFGNQEFDKSDTGVYDPETTSVHNVLWSGLTAGSAGGGLYWYWEIGNKAGWHALFRPIAAFVSDIPLESGAYEPIEPSVVGWAGAAATSSTPGPIALPTGGASWNEVEINTPNNFTIDRHGNASTPWLIPAILHPMQNARLGNQATFRADFTAEGWFGVRVTEVSNWGGSGVRISVDGEVVLEQRFADAKAIDAGDHLYRAAVDKGEHEIVVSAIGADWCRVTYEVMGVTDASSVPVWATGLARDDAHPGEVAGVLWVRHQAFSWGGVRAGTQREPIEPIRVVLPGLSPGQYEVEWVDTQTGERVGTSEASSEGESLELTTPGFTDSLAGKVRRR